jgi:hypothetical protein
MQDVDFPVLGIDDFGNSQMMYPGGEYQFPGNEVLELPQFGKGGLKQWFDEKWVDVKTGKDCGRSGKDKKGRPYPACRPSRRVNETTPKTTSEMSAKEKAKFKKKKTSGKRIDYNHKRMFGGSLPSYQDNGQVELVEPGTRDYSTAKYSGNLVHVDPISGNPWITLPEVEIDGRVDYDKYPYYNDLTEKEKEWFNKTGANYGEFFSKDSWTAPIMTRAARRKARIGKDKVTMADEVHAVVDPVLATVMTIPTGAVAGNVGRGLLSGYRAATPTVLNAGNTVGNFMNAPLTVGSTTLPGVTANNLLGAYGATDFALNRAPAIPGQVQRGEYGDAAFNVGMGALDLMGLKYTGAANQFLDTDFARGVSDLTKYKTLSNERTNAQTLINDSYRDISKADGAIADLNTELYKLTIPTTRSLRKQKLFTNQSWGEDSYVGRRLQALGYSGNTIWDPNSTGSRMVPFQNGQIVPGNKKGFELVTTGSNGLNTSVTNQGSIIDFNTGRTLKYNFNFPGGARTAIRLTPDGNARMSEIPSVSKFTPPEGLSSTVSGNINLIENQIPGFKVFGSSRGVADAGLPHVPGDYDGIITKANYDKMVAEGKYPLTDGSGFAKVHEVDINGNLEKIDFNVIEETADGKPTGKLAEQLYRNLDPQGYYEQAARVTAGEQKVVDIPYTADELIEKTNWSGRTIADAFETPSAGAKAKHINRPDVYIAYGDPAKLQEGFETYAKSFLGENANLGPKFSAEQLSNVEENLELLKSMQYPGDINAIASSPERMQVALQDYYINKTTLSRGIDRNRLIGGTDRQNIEDALTEWNVDAGGGNANGMGLNNVQLGDSGWGDIYSHKQFSIPTNNNSPKEFVESIVNYTDGTAPLSTGEVKIIRDILDKHGIPRRDQTDLTELTMKNLLTSLPQNKATESVLNDIAERTGRRYSIYNEFGDSQYAGSFGSFNNDGDILVYGNRYGDTGLVPTGKGLQTRLDNYNVNSTSNVNFNPYVYNPNLIKADWYRASSPGAFDKITKRAELTGINDQLTSANLGPSPFKVQRIKGYISEREAMRDALVQRAIDANSDIYNITRRLQNAEKQGTNLGIGAGVTGAGYFTYRGLKDGTSDNKKYGGKLIPRYSELPKAQDGKYLPPAVRDMYPKEDPIYYDGMLAETTVTAPKYDGPQIRRAFPGETDPVNTNFEFAGVDRTSGLSALRGLAKGVKKIVGLKEPAKTVIQPYSRKLDQTLYAPQKVYGRGMPNTDAEMNLRGQLVEQYNARNNAYHTVNITDDIRNSEYLRERAKVYGYNPDSDRDLALFLGTSPGGGGRRTGYENLLPEGYDILYSGNNPIQTYSRYGDFTNNATPYTTKFKLFNDNTSMLSDRQLFERIQALDGVNTYRPDLRIKTFNQGDNINDLVQGQIINTNTVHVPGLNQTNMMVGRTNVPVREPIDIRSGREMNGWPNAFQLGQGANFSNPSDYDFYFKQKGGSLPSYQDKGQVTQTRSEKVGRNEIPENKDLFSKHVMYPALLEGAAFMDWYGPKLNEAAGDMTRYAKEYLYSNPSTAVPTAIAHSKANDWLFENVRPVAYPTLLTGALTVASGMMGNNAPPALDADGNYTVDEEAWRRALGLKTEPKYILESQYKPSTAEDPNAKYYTISPSVLDRQKLVQEAQARNMQVGDKAYMESLAPYIVDGFMSQNEFSEIDPLQRFKMSVGEDDKGRYLSIYDKYDFSGPANEFIMPYEFYDRVYYKRGGKIPRYTGNLYR